MSEYLNEKKTLRKKEIEDKTEKQLIYDILIKTRGIYNIFLFFLCIFIICTFIWSIIYLALP